MANNHSETERWLWEAANEFRANSDLKSSEYATPFFELVFLRYADHRFTRSEKELTGKGSGRRAVGKEAYQAKGTMYLPPTARFSHLLSLQEGKNFGQASLTAIQQGRPTPIASGTAVATPARAFYSIEAGKRNKNMKIIEISSVNKNPYWKRLIKYLRQGEMGEVIELYRDAQYHRPERPCIVADVNLKASTEYLVVIVEETGLEETDVYLATGKQIRDEKPAKEIRSQLKRKHVQADIWRRFIRKQKHEETKKQTAKQKKLECKVKKLREEVKRLRLQDEYRTLKALLQGKNTKSKREPIPSDVRQLVWGRDGGQCVKCGATTGLEFDHIVPVTKGGANTANNIELLCKDCNLAKSNHIV